MIELIFKTIACSGLFIGFYLLILQREKMFAFNRFYLLATLFLSFAIPFMELGIERLVNAPEVSEIIPVGIQENDLKFNDYTAERNIQSLTVSQMDSKPTFNWWILVPGIYMIVTLLLLLRFVSNLVNILLITRLNQRIKKQGFTMVAINKKIPTFSFFNYLFVPGNEIKSGRIQPEIFRHELAHMRQKHSCDVLFIEFVKVFFWFNPFLFIYKKSIQTNHEFLADAEVLSQTEDTAYYQQLLLEKISSRPQTALASPFNYLITKKRFIMMTKKTSRIKTIALKLFSIPLLVVTMLVFSEKVSAQVQPGKGVSKELFRDYKKQIRKATVKVKNADGTKTEEIETKNLDTELLANIYEQMSDEQKMKVKPLPIKNHKIIRLNGADDLVLNLDDLDLDLGNLAELSELGIHAGDLGLKIAGGVIEGMDFENMDLEYFDSPEWEAKVAEIEKNAVEIEKYYNSPEWKNKIAEIEKNAAEVEKNAAEIEKYYNSPEFLKKIEEIERKAEEIEKYYESPEFQNKIKEIEKKAEQKSKEAERKAA